MWIAIQGYLSWICGYLGSIWDIYMPSIIPQRLATDPSHGRVRWNRRHLCQGVRCRLVWPGQWPVSQGWAPPAPAQERRAPTIGSALRPTGSGPAPTRLLSYDMVAGALRETGTGALRETGTGALRETGPAAVARILRAPPPSLDPALPLASAAPASCDGSANGGSNKSTSSGSPLPPVTL